MTPPSFPTIQLGTAYIIFPSIGNVNLFLHIYYELLPVCSPAPTTFSALTPNCNFLTMTGIRCILQSLSACEKI